MAADGMGADGMVTNGRLSGESVSTLRDGLELAGLHYARSPQLCTG